MAKHILDEYNLSVQEVLLVPSLGKLNSRLEAVLSPFIWAAPMDSVTSYELTDKLLSLGEYVVVSRYTDRDVLKRIIADFHEHPLLYLAIGFKDYKNIFDIIGELLAEDRISDNAKFNFALDIAHGDMIKAHEFISSLAEFSFIKDIMSGSICTPEAAIRCVKAGCTVLRVGVGPGAMCTTRFITGCGVPNLSAVYRIHKRLEGLSLREKVKIIADGGIDKPGKAVKYLAAGADGIMLGTAFAATRESPGWYEYEIPTIEGEILLRKNHRGQSSQQFMQDHSINNSATPEGESTTITYTGSTVESLVNEYRGGLRSAISYLGLTSIHELNPNNVTFIKVNNIK